VSRPVPLCHVSIASIPRGVLPSGAPIRATIRSDALPCAGSICSAWIADKGGSPLTATGYGVCGLVPRADSWKDPATP
jgi:hypothetical protein